MSDQALPPLPDLKRRRHGCRATKLLIYEGEEAEYAEFCETWRAEYQPESQLEEKRPRPGHRKSLAGTPLRPALL